LEGGGEDQDMTMQLAGVANDQDTPVSHKSTDSRTNGSLGAASSFCFLSFFLFPSSAPFVRSNRPGPIMGRVRSPSASLFSPLQGLGHDGQRRYLSGHAGYGNCTPRLQRDRMAGARPLGFRRPPLLFPVVGSCSCTRPVRLAVGGREGGGCCFFCFFV